MKIGVDIGHHEDTYELTGGKGIKGFEEHHFNLAVGEYFIEELKRHHIEYVLGQSIDAPNVVSLEDRVDIYNKEKCDIVLSFHADYNNNRDAKGHWCFYWHSSKNGKKLAETWDKWADKLLPNPDRNIYPCKPNTWSNFYINRVTSMPAITIEHAFFSNVDDLKLLKSDSFIRLSAEVAIRAVCEYFNVEYIGSEPKELSLLGDSEATKQQLYTWAKDKGMIEEGLSLIGMYYDICKPKGLNPVIQYLQMCHETGFLYRRGSAAGLDASYHNPCGLKITVGGGDYQASAHMKFDTWQDGIDAHTDHTALYAGVIGYPREDTKDPRHFDWILGRAKTVEQLSGKWAPSLSYHKNITKWYDEVSNIKIESDFMVSVVSGLQAEIRRLQDEIKDKDMILKQIHGLSGEGA